MAQIQRTALIGSSILLTGTNGWFYWKIQEQERLNEQIRLQLEQKLNQPPKGGTIGDFGKWMDKELYHFSNQEAEQHFNKISNPSVDRSKLSNFEQRELSTIESLTVSTALGATGVALGYASFVGVGICSIGLGAIGAGVMILLKQN